MPLHVEASVSLWAARTLGWLLTYGVHSTLLLGLVWVVARHGRVGDAARDALWKLGMIGGIVTATIQVSFTREPLGGQMRLFTPPGIAAMRKMAMLVMQERDSLRVTMSREATETVPAIRIVRGDSAVILRDTLRARAGGAGFVRLDPSREEHIFIRRAPVTPWPEILAGGWMLIAIGTLSMLALAHRRLSRQLSGRRRLPAGSPISSRLELLWRRTALRRPITVSQCDALSSPVALPRGEICLPPRALHELDESQQDSILAHEIAHLERRDPYWLLGARLIEAVLFFQPLNRLARRRIQETAEYLCDAWAVRRTGRPLSLARCLAVVAEWVGPQARSQPVAAMVENGGSPLIRRVRRILEPAPAPRARGAVPVVALGTVTLGVLACAAPRVAVFPARLAMARTTMLVQRLGPADTSAPVALPRRAPQPAASQVGRIRVSYIAEDSLGVFFATTGGTTGDSATRARIEATLARMRVEMRQRARAADSAATTAGIIGATYSPGPARAAAGPLPPSGQPIVSSTTLPGR